jgi:hypothetical protein
MYFKVISTCEVYVFNKTKSVLIGEVMFLRSTTLGEVLMWRWKKIDLYKLNISRKPFQEFQ